MLLVLAAAVAPSSQAASSLKYFGWYGDLSADDLAATSAHSNFAMTSTVAEAVAAKEAGQDVMLMVQEYFPGLFTATPDFKTKVRFGACASHPWQQPLPPFPQPRSPRNSASQWEPAVPVLGT